jgi:hypothetical protein
MQQKEVIVSIAPSEEKVNALVGIMHSRQNGMFNLRFKCFEFAPRVNPNKHQVET